MKGLFRLREGSSNCKHFVMSDALLIGFVTFSFPKSDIQYHVKIDLRCILSDTQSFAGSLSKLVLKKKNKFSCIELKKIWFYQRFIWIQ